MWWFILTFIVGLAVGRKRWLPAAFLRRTAWIVLPCLSLLIFALGSQLGGNHRLMRLLPTLGLQSVILAVAAMLGSALFAVAFTGILWPKPPMTSSEPPDRDPARDVPVHGDAGPRLPETSYRPTGLPKLPTLIVAMLFLGGAMGFLSQGKLSFPTLLQNAVFSLMLLGIGLEIGFDPRFWSQVKQASWRMFALPLVSVIGSVMGGVAGGWIVHAGIQTGMAVAAGCGWYSLAAVLVNQTLGPTAGAVAFLSNVIREVLCFLIIPILARRSWPLPAIAIGGATTMDTTLALFTRSGLNQVSIVYAFVHGAVASALVPVVIPAVLHVTFS